MTDLATIKAIYDGSDGEATKALYARLEAIGPAGVVALNVFRAQKCSSRAKGYRGRQYRNAAYDRKQWSMDNLCAALIVHAQALGIRWGWAFDAEQPRYKIVLYIELPTGQVSFHSATRGEGPDYPGEWDGMLGAAPGRICQWIERLLRDVEAQAA